jgi:hypothetical protein
MEVETSEIRKGGSQRVHQVRIPVMNPASTQRRALPRRSNAERAWQFITNHSFSSPDPFP